MSDHVGPSVLLRRIRSAWRWIARLRTINNPGMWITAVALSLVLTAWVVARPVADEQTYQRVCALIVLLTSTLGTAWGALSLRRRATNRTALPPEDKRICRSRLYLTFAVGSFTLGQYVWYYYELVAHDPPFPSLADAAYLLLYPFLIAGTLLLAPDRLLKRGRVLLDSLTSIVAVAVFSCYFLIGPTITDSQTSLLAKLLGAAYPLGDIVILFCILAVGSTLDQRRSVRLVLTLSAAVFFLVAADVAFLYRQLQQTYVSGTILDRHRRQRGPRRHRRRACR
jgi:hypothetical protein